MKISKLFHWLYAFIMFLPVFAVGGKLAYTIFNKNAKDSYDTQIQYKNITEFHNNTKYNFKNLVGNTIYVDTNSNLLNISNIEINNYAFASNASAKLSALYLTDNLNLRRVGTSYSGISFIVENTTYYIDFNNEFIDINFTLDSFNVTSTEDLYLTYFKEIYVNTLDNAFYYAVDQVRDNVLFSWANNSFLATPITYVTDLFGMPSDSPIITYLSYWLDISIIWLTFDVILYVPLLVHRWLDKGVLE